MDACSRSKHRVNMGDNNMRKLLIFLVIFTFIVLTSCSTNRQEDFTGQNMEDKIEEDISEISEEENVEFVYDVSNDLNATLVHNLQMVDNKVYLISYNRNNIYDDGFEAKVSVFSFEDNTLDIIYEWNSFLDPKQYFRAEQIADGSIMIYAGKFLMNHGSNNYVDYQSIHQDYYLDATYDFVNNRLFFIPAKESKSVFVFNQKNELVEKSYALDENEDSEYFLLSIKISPDGEKILTTKAIGHNRENIICMDSNGKEIFSINTPVKDPNLKIDWISNDKFVCYYSLNDNTEFIIYDLKGNILKRFETPFAIIGEAQHDFSKSYPFGVFCIYGDVTLKGLESELWIVDFEKGISQKIHKTQETIHAFDLTEDGKSIVWVEDLKLRKQNIA